MSPDWVTPADALKEFHFEGSHLMGFRKRKHLLLSRPVDSRPASNGNGYLYRRADLKQIREAMDNPSGRRFVDPSGVAWVNRHVAAAAPYLFPFTTLMRWHCDRKGCLLLSVDEKKKLEAQRIPVYKRRGFQMVWYFREDQLATIRNNINAGKVVSRVNSPGLTADEIKDFGRDLLQKWSDKNGKGVPELGGAQARRLEGGPD